MDAAIRIVSPESRVKVSVKQLRVQVPQLGQSWPIPHLANGRIFMSQRRKISAAITGALIVILAVMLVFAPREKWGYILGVMILSVASLFVQIRNKPR